MVPPLKIRLFIVLQPEEIPHTVLEFVDKSPHFPNKPLHLPWNKFGLNFFFFFLLIFLIFYIIYMNMYIQNMKITRTITRKTRTETYSLKGKHKPVYNRFTILKLYHLLVFS